jgi:hypothetical protein
MAFTARSYEIGKDKNGSYCKITATSKRTRVSIDESIREKAVSKKME